MLIEDNAKSICITITGSVQLSSLAMKIIDSPWFQRLRYLRQLGVAYLVYPCATETRFEHSIGVYGLARELLDSIKKNSDKDQLNSALSKVPELSKYLSNKKSEDMFLDDHITELIKIAALCHDIGHGPMSHTYDDYIHTCKKGVHHEKRSQMIVDKLLRKIIPDDELEFVKILIDPPKEREGFVYQIVCNKKNSIDVDKLDYVNRDSRAIGKSFIFDITPLVQQAIVIDDDLCYPVRLAYEITNLFTLRYMLFKQVCANKTVVSIQYMTFKLFSLLDKELDLVGDDLDNFCRLTDDFIRCYPKIINKDSEELREARHLLSNIEERKIYKTVVHRIFNSEENAEKFSTEMRQIYPPDSHIVHIGKIGLIPNGITDLFGNIYYYKNKDKNKKFTMDKEQISSILPVSCFEYYVMVFML